MEDKNLASKVLEGFVFTNLFKTFRFAIQPGKMAIALLAVIAMVATGYLMDLRPTVVAAPGVTIDDIAAAPAADTGMFTVRPATELHASLGGHVSWNDYRLLCADNGARIGVFSTIWEFCSARFDGIAIAMVKCDIQAVASNLLMIGGAAWWALRYHWLYTAIYLVISLVVMALAGGAVCRSAALQFARDERSGLVECVRYSSRRFGSFLTGPLWAAGIIALIAAVIFLMGLLGNIPSGVGPVVVGVLSPVAAMLGFLATVFIFGLVGSASLMLPAVAYEGSDGMDSMGRAFGYMYMRPWRMAFYTVISFIYGVICYLFVRIFALVLLLIARSCMTAGVRAWSEHGRTPDGAGIPLMDAIWPAPTFNTLFGTLPESLSTSEKIGAILVMVPQAIVAGLVAAFLLSFFFCACTIIYALLRKHVDGEAFDRIFTQVENTHIPAIDDEQDLPDTQ